MNVNATIEIGNYVPEILSGPGPHAGPYVQIEGHDGDAVIAGATVAGSATAWAGKTVYDGKPIEGSFTEITLTGGSLLAYKRRV